MTYTPLTREQLGAIRARSRAGRATQDDTAALLRHVAYLESDLWAARQGERSAIRQMGDARAIACRLTTALAYSGGVPAPTPVPTGGEPSCP